MDQDESPLSKQARAILQQIAAGRSYDQILLRYPDLGYQDIFEAAQEALTKLRTVHRERAMSPPASHAEPVVRAWPTADIDRTIDRTEVDTPAQPLPTIIERPRQTHAQTWAHWSPDEDIQLERLFRRGAHLAEIGQALGRQNSAIRARLANLGLIDDADDAPDLLLKPADAPAQSTPHSAPAPPPRASVEWERIRRRLEGSGPDGD